MKAKGVAGVVYNVGKVIQVWVGTGGVVGGVVVKAAGVWGVVYKVGKCRAEPGFGPTPPLQFSDGGGVRGPTQRSISQGVDPGGRSCPRQVPNDGDLDDTA